MKKTMVFMLTSATNDTSSLAEVLHPDWSPVCGLVTPGSHFGQETLHCWTLSRKDTFPEILWCCVAIEIAYLIYAILYSVLWISDKLSWISILFSSSVTWYLTHILHPKLRTCLRQVLPDNSLKCYQNVTKMFFLNCEVGSNYYI